MTFFLNECGIICALGEQQHEVRHNMLALARSGIAMSDAWSKGRPLPLGIVGANLPALDHHPVRLRSRNNQLALAALQQIRPAVDAAIKKYGADRIAIVLGTSTSGISGTEEALRHYAEHGALPADFHYAQQEMGSVAEFIASELQVQGPSYVHSSACSSSAKAMASAARLLQMNICDAVITGGVDSLCAFTVAGFSALESVSQQPCRPMSQHRDGINIGEGAALFLMTREPSRVALLGWGESSDGHHMSAPDPTGEGARKAIQQALDRAQITANEIDYINMHGTATVQNDAMESRVIHALFGDAVLVSSTKGFTGHTLGAAAAVEAALCWISMQDDNPQGLVPAHLWDEALDPDLPALNLGHAGSQLGRPIRYALSNSFAFGGSNASLLLGRIEKEIE
jgi:3-oxoacyl-[acyl-carrier-protein] synthase-1